MWLASSARWPRRWNCWTNAGRCWSSASCCRAAPALQHAAARAAAHVAGAAVHAADACPRRGDRTLRGRQPGPRCRPRRARTAPDRRGPGQWGTRWMPDLGDEDLDPHLLMGCPPQRRPGRRPPGRTVLRFRFRDVPGAARSWWLVITADGVDLCDFDPDHPLGHRHRGATRGPRHGLAWRPELVPGAAVRRPRAARTSPRAPRRAPLAAVVSLRPVPRPT